MIIKLDGADFSANNIGQIELPVELHAFTKKIFQHYTRFSENSEVAQRVNKFILTLDEQGVLEHLGCFIAPYLASNISEAVYDVVNDVTLTYDQELSYEGSGVIKVSASKKGIAFNEALPTVNFFGGVVISSSSNNYYPIFFNSSFKPVLYGRAGSNSWISDTSNYNTNHGYKVSTSSPSSNCLFNITELSNLDSGNTTINGISVVPSGTYDKANEPFNNTINKVGPSIADVEVGCILFAGDGTTLNSTQITAIVNAMTTLKNNI